MSEGDYPPLPSATMKNARDNTSTSLYVHMVRKLRTDNLTLHVFRSKTSSHTHPLLSPVSATRPIYVIFLDFITVEYQMKRKILILTSYNLIHSSAASLFLGPHIFFGLLFSNSFIHQYILPTEEDTKTLKITQTKSRHSLLGSTFSSP